MRHPFFVGGEGVLPGQRHVVDIPLPQLYTHAALAMPVQVVRGRREGPTLFVSAALHGDEINGVEIIRRLLNLGILRRMRGTLLAVPVVNVYGFIGHSRYLPDRRDLNRSFPGSERGSMAARLANLFMMEIVAKADFGIDLHTAAIHRNNLPQIRANLNDAETRRLAMAFHAPVVINSGLLDGSLRKAASLAGVPVLVYEAGEALRFDELAIRAGVRGIVSVMRELGMLRKGKEAKHPVESMVARFSGWLRAPQSGILRAVTQLGAAVERGQLLGVVSDPFGESEAAVEARYDGIVIGRTNLPLVNEGEALFHIARFRDTEGVVDTLESFQQEFDPSLDIMPPEDLPLV